MVDIIELTNRSRVTVTPDLDAGDPRREEVITGTYTEPSLWGRTEGPLPRYDFPGDIVRAADELNSQDVIRWAWIFHGIVVQEVRGTFWYCDREQFRLLHGGEFTREAQADVIQAEVVEYEHYVNGDARVIELQRLARFRRTTRKYLEHHQDLLEVWETIASVAVAYLSEAWTLTDVMVEHFTPSLNNRERAVIAAMLDEERALHG